MKISGAKIAHIINMYLREQPGFHISTEIGPGDGEKILKDFLAKMKPKKVEED